MSKHGKLYQEALDAINRLFSDMSVSKEQTRESLQALIDDIEMKLESVLP